jgi:hypothetical protein
MRATTTVPPAARPAPLLLPALGEYFEPAGTAASAVSSDDNAKELGAWKDDDDEEEEGEETGRVRRRQPRGCAPTGCARAARLNARFRLGVPSDDLQAAGVLVHINDRTDDPAHRWKPCYKACNHGQYWASMPTASRYLFYLSIPDDRVAGTVSCIFASPSLPGLQLLGVPFGAQRVACPCFFCIPKLAWLAISLTSFIYRLIAYRQSLP